jgi:hypothetical protein
LSLAASLGNRASRQPRPLDSSFDAETTRIFENATGIHLPPTLVPQSSGQDQRDICGVQSSRDLEFVGEARNILKATDPVLG